MAEHKGILNPVPKNRGGYNFSTEEQYLGKWIDGSDYYGKTIVFGALPNATTKAVSHNISNIGKVIDYFGTAIRADKNTMSLPVVSVINLSYGVNIYVTATSVSIETAYNYSAFTETYITILYTKTS